MTVLLNVRNMAAPKLAVLISSPNVNWRVGLYLLRLRKRSLFILQCFFLIFTEEDKKLDFIKLASHSFCRKYPKLKADYEKQSYKQEPAVEYPDNREK